MHAMFCGPSGWGEGLTILALLCVPSNWGYGFIILALWVARRVGVRDSQSMVCCVAPHS